MNHAARCVRHVAQAGRPGALAVLSVLLMCWMPSLASAGQAKTPLKTPKNHQSVVASKVDPKAAPTVLAAKPAPEAALGPEELAIAQQVERGVVTCELGVNVRVTEDAKAPGHFDVQASKYRFRMTPVTTSTGAIRLEDKQAGAVWLQLPHKSMLMSQKLGSRLADACVTPAQAQIAMALEKNPRPSLLESSSATLTMPQSIQ